MALKVIEWLKNQSNMYSIEQNGEWLAGELKLMKGIASVRQIGLMLAVDTEFDSKTFGEIAIKHGLICGSFRSSTLKIYPPLDISASQKHDGLNRFESAVKEAMS